MQMVGNYKAAILGLKSTEISDEERVFFTKTQPIGYILFARNCESPEQLLRLTQDLRSISSQTNLMILIDQEGGRVARLKSPLWRDAPAAAGLVSSACGDARKAKKLIYLNARLIAAELLQNGVTVNCAPLADVPVADCDDIIGDRAYGDSPEIVAEFAREMSRGLLDGGVLPVLKHIPGHGRATVDSHKKLPIVTTKIDDLRESDFIPFAKLNDIPLGMTAHVVFSNIDDQNTATTSPKIINEIIRDELGFDGLLMSDDISMKALQGDLGELTKSIIAAGCDVVLHCNGDMTEMKTIMAACPFMSDEATRRLKNAWQVLENNCVDRNNTESCKDLLAEFNELYHSSSEVV